MKLEMNLHVVGRIWITPHSDSAKGNISHTVAGSVNTNSKDKTLKKCCSIVSNYGLQDNDTETALVGDIVTTANFVAGKQW